MTDRGTLKHSSSSRSSILWKPRSSQAVPVSSSASTAGGLSQLDFSPQLSAAAAFAWGSQRRPICSSGLPGGGELKASSPPHMHEPLWWSCALLFQMLCMCNLCNRSRKRKLAKGGQNQTVLLIIPVVGVERKVLSKPQLCVPWWFFSFSTTTLLYSAQTAVPWSLIVFFYSLSPLQSAALLCPLPSAILHRIPLSLLPKRVLKCHRTDLEVSDTVRRTDQKCHGSFAAWNLGSGEG